MITNKLVNRYAFSLLEIAKEKNVQQEVYNNAVAFTEIYCKSDEFILLLKNPVIPGQNKFTILSNLLGKGFNDLTKAFIKSVINHKREVLLPEILTEYISLYKKTLGVIKADIVTAMPVEDDFITKISEKVRTFSGFPGVEIQNIVDEKIIGGFILKFEDKVIDASVANKLKQIKIKLQASGIS